MKGRGAAGKRAGQQPPVPLSSEAPLPDQAAADVPMDELRDFLAADHLDVPVDPAFKERLRRRLWDLVVARVGKSASDEEL